MEVEKVYFIYKHTIKHKRDSIAKLIENIGFCIIKIDKRFTYYFNFEKDNLIEGLTKR